jgi:hypothetical protein
MIGIVDLAADNSHHASATSPAPTDHRRAGREDPLTGPSGGPQTTERLNSQLRSQSCERRFAPKLSYQKLNYPARSSELAAIYDTLPHELSGIGSGKRNLGGKQGAVTRPRRQFTPKDLRSLTRSQARKLAQIVLTEAGARIVGYNHPAGYDEFVLEVVPLWSARRIRARILTSSLSQKDVDRLADRVAEDGDSEGLLFAVHDADAPNVDRPPNISVVSATEMVARLKRSALVGWKDQRPSPSYDLLATQRILDRDASFLDPVGIRWLPTLALNELPPDLRDGEVEPQDVLERIAFRLLTSVFRFGGERYGEAMRGQRLPDALLTFQRTDLTFVGVLLDCKATASGYKMESDHELRFHHYVNTLSPELAERGIDLQFVAVLSSSFSGRSGSRHPFHQRNQRMQEKVGVRLSYLRAVDLARTAVSVMSNELSPAKREGLDWESVFGAGLITTPDLVAMIAEAS